MDEVNLTGAAESEGMDGAEISANLRVGAAGPSSESSTFARCLGCANAEVIDRSAGTLVCGKYSMRINAEADEIPDDCVGFVAAEGEAADP